MREGFEYLLRRCVALEKGLTEALKLLKDVPNVDNVREVLRGAFYNGDTITPDDISKFLKDQPFS